MGYVLYLTLQYLFQGDAHERMRLSSSATISCAAKQEDGESEMAGGATGYD